MTTPTDEKCPDCGKTIMLHSVEILGQKIEQKQECPCVTERKEQKRQERIVAGRKNIAQRRKIEAGLKKRQFLQTFDSFQPKPGQEEAYKLAKQFAETPKNKGLMLIGSVGCGKTHLSAAIANSFIDGIEITDRQAEDEGGGFTAMCKFKAIKFSSTVDLIAEIKQSFDTGEETQNIIDGYAKAKVLVLDDLGTEKPTEWACERLFEIIDHRYNEMLPTVITTNAKPKDLKERLGDRIYDRLREMCKMVVIKEASQRETA